MADVKETQLPGVGVRYEFTSEEGDLVGVVRHHSGRREIMVYDRADPDRADSVLQLTEADSRLVSDLLGASRLIESLGAVRQPLEGLSLEWIDVQADSAMAGHSIADGQLRTKTGASVVAVIRGSSTEPAPGPEFVLNAHDVVVAVGTPEGLERLRAELVG